MIRRCSIIGFGSMGQKHAKNALDLGLSVKYWDPDNELVDPKFENARSELAALEWCDIVIIASTTKMPQFKFSICDICGKTLSG